METMEVIAGAKAKGTFLPVIDPVIIDPLEADRPDDEIVVTTKRAMTRIALVAVETGGRFEREGIAHDPMSWMLAPRRLFNGGAAIDACLDLEHCRRSILVHGLGLGLDVAPAVIDALVAEDEPDDEDELVGGDEIEALATGRRAFHSPHSQRPLRQKLRRDGSPSVTGLQLWTATLCYSTDVLILNAFHASLANDALEIALRLRERYGPEAAATADIRLGFHQAVPVTVALVQAPIAEMIRAVEDEPSLADPRRFAVNVEQRIQP